MGSQAPRLHPLRFEPILKRLIWGGRRLGEALDKPIGDGDDYAESWEISDHRQDISIVAEGPLQGASLRDLIRDRPRELFGAALSRADRNQFPLLVKFIDAQQPLSVQVHPDDALGRKLADDNGKTEVWIAMAAEPGSLIYAGLKSGVDRATFEAALDSGEVEPLLHRFEPKPGDCIFIPAGTVHAIGAGVLLAEIQQMSDATFRVFDWGRVGGDGKPRRLHREEALASIDFNAGPVDPRSAEPEPILSGTRERLAACPYFVVDRLKARRPIAIGDRDRFTIAIIVDGSAELRSDQGAFEMRFGQTWLLPAALGPCEIAPRGEATILTCVAP